MKFRSAFVILICFFILTVSYDSRAESGNEPLWGASRDYDRVKVERVVRADTIVLQSGERIHFIGLEAPEAPHREAVQTDSHGFVIENVKPTTTVGEQALDFAQNFLQGKYIRLEFDAQKKNDAYETLAYAYLPDGTFVNAEILRQGFANLKIIPPNTKYIQALRKAYQEARKEKRGLQSE